MPAPGNNDTIPHTLRTLGWAALASLMLCFSAGGIALAQTADANSGTKQADSIFKGTMADMTYRQYEDAVKSGAIAIWALGVIEEHGPHLPLGTDVYVPTKAIELARTELRAANIQSVVVPAFYWGVNQVTGAFPGSINVRPEVIGELMLDVFRSLKKDGLTKVFCISGHNDVAHNRALYEGVRRGRADPAVAGLEIRFVTDSFMVQRLALEKSDPALAVIGDGPAPPPSPYFDVHAGTGETSMLWAAAPNLVATDLLPTLKPNLIDAVALAQWRKGGEHARRITPDGYTGDPSKASAELGTRLLANRAKALAQAILSAGK